MIILEFISSFFPSSLVSFVCSGVGNLLTELYWLVQLASSSAGPSVARRPPRRSLAMQAFRDAYRQFWSADGDPRATDRHARERRK